MSPEPTVAKAKFTPKTGPNQKSFDVHFNPVSLQYSVSNTLKEEGEGKTKKQYVTQGTGKLTMDLIFDSTGTGEDVRTSTKKVSDLMQADPRSSGSKKQVPSIVLFEWGAYKFQGMMESYKETLDFFAPGGVPLRASVNITLVEQDKIFEAAKSSALPRAVNVRAGAGSNPSSVASAGGAPGAARALAALNGESSVRFSAGPSLTVPEGVTLAPPATFSPAAGTGNGNGTGAGISPGAGSSVGAGRAASGLGGPEARPTAGAIFGSSRSAGVPASQGAFAGLRAPFAQPAASLDTGRFLQVSESVSVSTSEGTSFSVGGRAMSTGTSGLGADVGANADLRARIQFEVE